MKYAKGIFLIMLAVFLLAIATASASDLNDTQLANEEESAIELSDDEEIIKENTQTQSASEDTVGVNDESEVLGDGEGTYADLRNEIGNGGNINLTKSAYHYRNDGDTIRITTSGTIDGNGAVIDMAGSSIRALHVDASDVTIKNLTFVNANYDGNGGAIYFGGSGTVENCNFTGNSASSGGAIYFRGTGNVTNSNFTDNKAREDGGAVYFVYESRSTFENCTFVNNYAGSYGGAIRMSTGSVETCNFVGNSASERAGAIYSIQQSSTVDTCIFKTDSDKTFNTVNLPPTLNVDDFTTFYGSGEKVTFDLKTNKGIPIYNGNILISVYYKDGSWVGDYSCLSGEDWTADLPVASYYAIFNTEYVGFEPVKRTVTVTIPNVMYHINVTSLETNNRTVNITAKSDIPNDMLWDGKLLFIAPDNIVIESSYAGNGTWWAVYTFDDYGLYQIGASYARLDNVSVNNATISMLRSDSTLVVDNVVMDYGESVDVGVTAEGAVGITAKIDGVEVAVEGYAIRISDLNAGNHTLMVATVPDYEHNSVNRTVNITVNKVDSTLVLDDVVMDYGESVDVGVTAEGAAGIIAKIDGVEVAVEGYAIGISGLNAGNHTLMVATVPDCEHNSVNRTVNITVNKVDSTLVLDDVVMDCGESVDVGVTAEGAVGIIAKIDGVEVAVEGYAIRIFDLNAGNHTLMVSTVPDGNHKSVSKTVSITVNKEGSSLTVDGVVFDYGGVGSARVSYVNASGVVASVVGQSGAVVNVANNTITISGLDVGLYTLSVTTITDTNHNNITKTVNVTVNKLKTELSANPLSATYKINRDLVITLKNSNGKALTGMKVDINLNGAKTYITDNNGQIRIQTKALVAKVYTAKITFNGNTNYGNSTKDVSVTVKKAANPLKVKGKTVKIKFKKLKKKAQKLKVKKVVKFTKKGVGSLTYKKVKGNKKISINKKTGKIIIKKGLKKGTYKVKMKIRAKGNSNYNASGYKTVTFKIKLK